MKKLIFALLLIPCIAAARPLPKTKTLAPTARHWLIKEWKNEFNESRTDYCVVSNNVIQQSFPYGSTRFYLCISRQPTEDDQVMVYADRDSNILTSEDARVKFDESEISDYSITGTTDYDPSVFFFADSHLMIENIRKSKKVLVGFTIFNQGEAIAIFDIPPINF